jgi:Protein of unknown function (DUF1549)/Protein of unknown function (DUF1553)
MPMKHAKDYTHPPAFRLKRLVVLVFVALLIAAVHRSGVPTTSLAAWQSPSPTNEFDGTATADDCSFLRKPETAKEALARHRAEVVRATEKFSQESAFAPADIRLIAPQDIPRKNFIDNILFDKMAKDSVMSAAIASDAEFIRRVYLDLTGRIPSAAAVTSFLNDSNVNKRDALVDSLIGTPEYIDKWTMFFGDLFKNTGRATNVVRYTGGRDAFYTYIKNSVSSNKNYAQMATDMIANSGDNFVEGETNFIVGGIIPMGPRTGQDTMDGTAVVTASMFLGINSLDCLLCHNGRGHLESVNLWGSKRSREEAWGMAAFFARTRTQRQSLSVQPNYAKYIVSELAAGEYNLNTNTGNRPNREITNGKTVIAPRYILNGNGGVSAGENRRQAMARLVTADRQFARAAVNYIWEKIMVEALVSPSNTFDPDRLDPNATLPSGWTLQPANAQLLEALADNFIQSNYNLRALIATIVKSNAYQLSSQYPGTWSAALIPYYARKYVRRLDAEEVHDAIMTATGIGVTYQLRDQLGVNTWAVNWAMQLPDPNTPGGNASTFLNSFLRGDRDVKPRSQEPSIQQALNLMNNTFVMTRIHQNNANSTVSKLLANTALTSQDIITQLYLNTLSRNPTTAESNALLPLFSSQTKRDATEGIQWALLNKVDFVFNY